MIQKASWCGNNNIDTPSQALDLVLHIDAAIDREALQSREATVRRDEILALLSKLSRRSEDECPRMPVTRMSRDLRQMMEQRKHERSGFPCACLGTADDISSCYSKRNGACLNGSWCRVARGKDTLNELV